MDNHEFYRRCAEILGTEDTYTPFPHDYRTRWNNRAAGSGRFPDHGIVRRFGDSVQVALRRPCEVHRTFDTPEAALAFLRGLNAPEGDSRE
jgi:hypothetical protein